MFNRRNKTLNWRASKRMLVLNNRVWEVFAQTSKESRKRTQLHQSFVWKIIKNGVCIRKSSKMRRRGRPFQAPKWRNSKIHSASRVPNCHQSILEHYLDIPILGPCRKTRQNSRSEWDFTLIKNLKHWDCFFDLKVYNSSSRKFARNWCLHIHDQ